MWPSYCKVAFHGLSMHVLGLQARARSAGEHNSLAVVWALTVPCCGGSCCQDGDGFITAEDLVKVMPRGSSIELAREMVNEVDKNNDGRVDYAEVGAGIGDTGFGRGCTLRRGCARVCDIG